MSKKPNVPMARTFSVEHSAHLRALMHTKARTICIMGPPGSGKTAAIIMRIMKRASEMAPNASYVRETRVLVMRGTVKSFKESVISVLQKWFYDLGGPGVLGENGNAPRAIYEYKGQSRVYDYDKYGNRKVRLNPDGTEMFAPDGTTVRIIFSFYGALTPNIMTKVKSTQFDILYLNEATETPESVYLEAKSRLRDGKKEIPDRFRVPEGEYDPGVVREVLMDFNPPTFGHWLVEFCENPQKDMIFIKQPPAVLEEFDANGVSTGYVVNPKADNLLYLDEGAKYYEKAIIDCLHVGAVRRLRNQYMLEYGEPEDVRPVFENFSREYHVSTEPLKPLPGVEVLLGFDTSGIHPAIVFAQLNRGRLEIHKAITVERVGLEQFLDEFVVPELSSVYPGCSAVAICDPSNTPSSSSAVSPTDYIGRLGIPYAKNRMAQLRAVKARTNNFDDRVNAVASKLLQRNEPGQTGIIFNSVGCELLIDGLEYGYCFERIEGGTDGLGLFSSKVNKNKTRPYSDLVDALQYLVMHTNMPSMSETELRLRRQQVQSYARSRSTRIL